MNYLIFLLSCLSFFQALGQDAIEAKMYWYSKATPASNLFVHFDKNVYSNYEMVWFTGYLLKEAHAPREKHTIMAVSLIRNVDSTLVLTKKFVMTNGISFGNFEIPDSLQTGDYHFIAYTNQLINNIPEAIFIQQITLKTSIDPPFKASIKLIDAIKQEDKFYKVLVAATTKDDRFLPKPLDIHLRYGSFRQKGKTDQVGQLLLTLPFQPNISNPNVYVKLANKQDSTFISMALPILKNKATVKFYPEGGNIVAGIPTIIGFEVKDQQQMPIATTALLYKNQTVIDTIETNSYGLGRFRLRYNKNDKYSIKLIHDGVVDSIYQLPTAIDNGLIMNVAQAVVKDTIRLNLKSFALQPLLIRLHNFRTSFLTIPFKLTAQNMVVKIPLEDVPKGLLTITISDSLDRPLIERMIYAHYNGIEKIQLTSAKNNYQQREKVNLRIHLADTTANGFVSVAVVQDNRLEMRKMTDIESYTNLKSFLDNLPIQINGLPFKDRNYLEQILLIKGWSKYNWNGIEQVNARDTLLKTDSLNFTAQITKGNKLLKNEVSVGAYGDTKLRLSNSTATGFVDLSNATFTSDEKKDFFLFVNNAGKKNYQINVKDPFLAMSGNLRSYGMADDIVLPSTLINNAVLVLKNNEKSIRLKEVVIQSKQDQSFYGSQGTLGKNACGDYVCIYNIFNCRNHISDPNNTQPIMGRFYKGLNGPYKGCSRMNKIDESFVRYDAIKYGKEFYEDDYKDLKEPAFFSTIYWNYGLLVDGKKDINLEFYTSDITGKFRVVVQGIINNDVAYSQHFFEVKGK